MPSGRRRSVLSVNRTPGRDSFVVRTLHTPVRGCGHGIRCVLCVTFSPSLARRRIPRTLILMSTCEKSVSGIRQFRLFRPSCKGAGRDGLTARRIRAFWVRLGHSLLRPRPGRILWGRPTAPEMLGSAAYPHLSIAAVAQESLLIGDTTVTALNARPPCAPGAVLSILPAVCAEQELASERSGNS